MWHDSFEDDWEEDLGPYSPPGWMPDEIAKRAPRFWRMVIIKEDNDVSVMHSKMPGWMEHDDVLRINDLENYRPTIYLQEVPDPPPRHFKGNYPIAWHIEATNPKTQHRHEFIIESPMLSWAVDHARKEGYVADMHITAEGCPGEFSQPWGTFHYYAVNPETNRKRNAQVYAASFEDAVHKLEQSGVEVIEWRHDRTVGAHHTLYRLAEA